MSNSRAAAMASSLYVNVKWKLAQAAKVAKREGSATSERALPDDGRCTNALRPTFGARGAQFGVGRMLLRLMRCQFVAAACAQRVVTPARMAITEPTEEAARDRQILHCRHCLNGNGEFAVEGADGRGAKDPEQESGKAEG